jgi:hypothetical protein
VISLSGTSTCGHYHELWLIVLCERLDSTHLDQRLKLLKYCHTLITEVAYRGCPVQAYPQSKVCGGGDKRKLMGSVFSKLSFDFCQVVMCLCFSGCQIPNLPL